MRRSHALTLAAFAALALGLSAASLFGKDARSSRLVILSTSDGIGETSPCG